MILGWCSLLFIVENTYRGHSALGMHCHLQGNLLPHRQEKLHQGLNQQMAEPAEGREFTDAHCTRTISPSWWKIFLPLASHRVSRQPWLQAVAPRSNIPLSRRHPLPLLHRRQLAGGLPSKKTLTSWLRLGGFQTCGLYWTVRVVAAIPAGSPPWPKALHLTSAPSSSKVGSMCNRVRVW